MTRACGKEARDMKKKSLKDNGRGFRFFNGVLMVLICAIMLYPFLHVLFASVSNPNALIRHRGLLLHPKGFNLGAYKLVLRNPNILTGYMNTITYVVLGTAINITMTVISAFVLSRKNFLLRRPLMFLAIITMYFNGGMIPLYLQVLKLKLINTIWAIVLPTAMSTYNLIIMRTAFENIPDSLEESAMLDGANELVTLVKIIVPLAMPTIAVILLFYSVGIWNSWFNALIYLQDRTLYPLQLILREILIANDTSSMTAGTAGDVVPLAESVKYATIVVATLPVLVIYPFLQKYFVKGVLIGAVKG